MIHFCIFVCEVVFSYEFLLLFQFYTLLHRRQGSMCVCVTLHSTLFGYCPHINQRHRFIMSCCFPGHFPKQCMTFSPCALFNYVRLLFRSCVMLFFTKLTKVNQSVLQISNNKKTQFSSEEMQFSVSYKLVAKASAFHISACKFFFQKCENLSAEKDFLL